MGNVAFDIGNVICKVDINYFLEYMIKTKCATNKVHAHFLIASMSNESFIGLTDIVKVVKELNPSLDSEEIVDKWNGVLSIDNRMVDFIDEVSKHSEVALLSNMGSDHAKFLRRSVPELFEKCVEHLSFEVGAYKPQKLFYQSFLLENPQFAGCLFIDDLQENLNMAINCGFSTMLFDLNKIASDFEFKNVTDLIEGKI